MTTPTQLSPAAQAVLDAAEDHGKFSYKLLAAAALRAAADQVVPPALEEEFFDRNNEFSCRESSLMELQKMVEVRLELLAIAAELDGGALAEPQPPADGEVEELVRLLHQAAENDEWDGASPEWCGALNRAAALLEQQQHLLWLSAKEHENLLERQHPQPIPVAERLPEANIKVLAHYTNELGKGRTICAIWVPAKSRSEDHDLSDDDFTEYDEQDDKFYWPEGWYEAIENWDELGWVKVHEGEVAYWQPLPQWPAHALPLPNDA